MIVQLGIQDHDTSTLERHGVERVVVHRRFGANHKETNMHRRRFLTMAATAPLTVALAAQAQAYPTRPVHLIVPFAPGGPTDSFARLYADALGKQLGQTVVVENKAGASGTIGALEVKNSPPDGYKLLFGTASTQSLYNLIEANPRYDALADFDYVAVLGGAPLAIAVSTAVPGSLKDIVAAAKKDPGKFNYGSPGTGTLLQVSVEQFKQCSIPRR
jgi:tripartite-type tricarboxylate transporter receptor subunit TctC